MVRQGSLLISALVLLLGMNPAGAQSPPTRPEPIDRKPYAIRLLLDIDPPTRIDAIGRSAMLEEWFDLLERFVGAPWSVEIADDLGVFPGINIQDLKADDLKPRSEKADKVWAVRIRRNGPTLILEGRELDVATGWLGEVHRREVAHPVDLARELLRLAIAMFTPSAEVGETSGGGVYFLVQAGSLPASSPLGDVAPIGSVFRALRIFPRPDGASPEIVEVKYSYFRVQRRDGPNAYCEIIQGMRDPLTNRYARANKLVALGIKPSSATTRLRFLLRDRSPAVGFRVIARSIPPGPKPTELGMTDREGRIEIPAGFAETLVSIRLLAGNDEPMVDIPVMPGETPEERTLTNIDPRTQTLALEAKLDALRDSIIDLVAVRSRLEARMKARFDGEDWVGLDATIAEFRKLTPRDHFETRLNRIREEGERQELETKTLVLTKTARAQLDETKGLIDRYLDDDLLRTYEDAAQRAKAELEKPKDTKKGTTKKAPPASE